MAIPLILAYLAVWFAVTTAYMLAAGRGGADGRLSVSPLVVVIRTPIVFRVFDRLQGSRIIGFLLDLGIAASFVLLVVFYYSFLRLFIGFLSTGQSAGAVTPILPGVTISLQAFLYMLPGFSLAIILHELFHALASRHAGIPVKSSGFMVIMGLLPAAFVEPDEDALRKAPTRTKLRVYAAGVLANLIVFLALQGFIYALSEPGMYTVIVDVDRDSPAAQAGVKPGTLVYYFIVNNTKLEGIAGLTGYLAELRSNYNGSLANIALEVILVTPEGNITIIKPRAPPGSDKTRYERIGIYMYDVPAGITRLARNPLTAVKLALTIMYALVINYSLALINAAPLFITDGARIVQELAARIVGEKKAALVTNIVSLATLGIMLPSIRL